MNYASYKTLFKELKNGIEIIVGQAVFKLKINMIKQSKFSFWINNSGTAWPTLILMLFLSSLDNLLSDAYIIFQKDVDNFEIENKTCNFGAFCGRRCSTPLRVLRTVYRRVVSAMFVRLP